MASSSSQVAALNRNEKTACVPRTWSTNRFVCDNCKEWLYIAGWADRLASTPVIAGISLLGLVMDYHRRSGCVAGTARDLEAHGIKIP